MSGRIENVRPQLDLAVHTFHSFCLDILKENVLASWLSVAGGIISRATQLDRGLRNIDAFGFEHVQVGNNPAEIVRAVIDGISVFREVRLCTDRNNGVYRL
jgi:DNA helicase-2/ATP-dependent DNA helicase PcrA